MIAPLMTVVRSMCATIQKSRRRRRLPGRGHGYRGSGKLAGIPLEIVKRSDAAKGFVVLPKRWIVERTFGWLGRCRRLTKDFENLQVPRRIRHSRHDPAHDPQNRKALSKLMNRSDRL